MCGMPLLFDSTITVTTSLFSKIFITFQTFPLGVRFRLRLTFVLRVRVRVRIRVKG